MMTGAGNGNTGGNGKLPRASGVRVSEDLEPDISFTKFKDNPDIPDEGLDLDLDELDIVPENIKSSVRFKAGFTPRSSSLSVGATNSINTDMSNANDYGNGNGVPPILSNLNDDRTEGYGLPPVASEQSFGIGLNISTSSKENGYNNANTIGNASTGTGRLGGGRTRSYTLDDTEHNIKGKGILASKKDVKVSPDEFAAGCKLLQSAALGDATGVKRYLAIRPDHIFFRDYDRRTALHVAASEGKLDVVKMLIERYNSPIHRSDRWGGSPLDDAHRHRHVEVVQYLRSRGASTGSTDQITNLITAAATGDLDDVKMLLGDQEADEGGNNKGKVIGDSSTKKKSILNLALINNILSSNEGSKGKDSIRSNKPGNGQMKSKFDINGKDYDGRTALHLSSAAGHVHVLRFLISRKADVNVVDNWGGRPLDDATRMNRMACIQVLKEAGATAGKRTPLNDSSTKDRTTKLREDKNLKIEFSELDMIDKIGAGAFGEIYKCRWRGTLVAAKCIRNTKIVELWREENINIVKPRQRFKAKVGDHEMNADEVEEALNDFHMETHILQTLRHPNICMMLGYSQTENFEVMISELMRCSLLDIFKSHLINNTRMTKKNQILYAQQLARGMNYLHKCKPPIIHRDLKPANLLIDVSGTLKISDFGLAKVRPDPKKTEIDEFRMTGETGSYRFMAPEVFRHENYTETVDVYSFAMIFYFLLSGKPPWPELNGLNAVTKAAMEADRPIVARNWDMSVSNLMQECWAENPTARPSFATISEKLQEYSTRILNLDANNISMADLETRRCRCVIM